jgi:hypothetical protein
VIPMTWSPFVPEQPGGAPHGWLGCSRS